METQRELSDDQEQMRLEGLRILARMIARHALAHPGRYGDNSQGGEARLAPLYTQLEAGGPPEQTDDAA